MVKSEPRGSAGTALPHESAILHVTGSATYIDDLPELRRTLHAAIGLATEAHARILSIDLSAVRAAPGVVCVLTADDIPGLNDFVTAEGEVLHPPVGPVFWSFRIMVGMGMLMLLVSWVGCWQLYRRNEISPLMLKVFVGMTFSGWIATLAGWYVTEIGRQPWLVTGVLKTADAVTSTPASNVGTSLAIYLTLYVVLLIAYIRTLFVMARKSVLVDRTEGVDTLQEKLVENNL